MPPYFGEELEVAVTGLKNGHAADHGITLRLVEEALLSQVPHLQGIYGSGHFLANASRLYIDCMKLEYASAESDRPETSALYTLAGYRLLETAARRVEKTHRHLFDRIFARIGNVDYLANTTWACHQNVSHRREFGNNVVDNLISFLVSRMPLAGGGGFNASSPGIEFLLSPRSQYLVSERSTNSTSDKGIYHIKGEHLSSNGLKRCHVLFAESLLSHLGLFIRSGSLALFVAAADEGVFDDRELTLSSPLTAMRTIARDVEFKNPVSTAGGRMVTALDLQERFVERIESVADKGSMPDWTRRFLPRWRHLIQRVASHQAGTALDCWLKLNLFQRTATRQGFEWESFEQIWNPAFKKLHRALRAIQGEDNLLLLEDVLNAGSPLAPAVEAVVGEIKPYGYSKDDLARVVQLKHDLCLLDMRYGELSDRSIFRVLDHKGVLDHQIPEITESGIVRAMKSPPPGGRARIRGEMVRELAGEKEAGCDWQMVVDRRRNREMLLPDPAMTAAKWVEIDKSERGRIRRPFSFSFEDRETMIARLTRVRRGVE